MLKVFKVKQAASRLNSYHKNIKDQKRLICWFWKRLQRERKILSLTFLSELMNQMKGRIKSNCGQPRFDYAEENLVLLWKNGAVTITHRDRGIYVERAYHCIHAIMTWHGLINKVFHINWLSWAHGYKQTISCLNKWPNLAYSDVKLNIACMHALACLNTLYLCVYYDLYAFTQGYFYPRLSSFKASIPSRTVYSISLSIHFPSLRIYDWFLKVAWTTRRT